MGGAASFIADHAASIGGFVLGGIPGAIEGTMVGDLFRGPGDPPAPIPPPPTPDLADELSKRADLVKQMRLMASGTGDFVSGPYGDPSKPPGAPPVARGQ